MAATDTSAAPRLLPSYIQDSWWTPESPEKVSEILDASTSEPVCRVSTEGLDTGAAVAHARSAGQASLGQLTIHQRALRLKHLAAHLHEHREELYELSDRTGSTRRDHLIDVDGGIGTIRTFSSKGRKELPNANVIVDGQVEQLSRDGSFLGEHIYTGSAVSPCRSTPSTSPSGACSKSSHRASSPGCRPS